MNILFIGDIVGEPGRKAVAALLPGLREKWNLDCVIANGENAAGGLGLTPRLAKEIFRGGCDAITLGDHVWDRPEIMDYLDEEPRIVRPLNFPDGAPGRGWCVVETSGGEKIGIINLLGRVFMRYNVRCPFLGLQSAADSLKERGVRVIFADMHAEATSEKIALGWFADGKVSAVVGTHTHVQTSDERVLPAGTAYITDAGMTGPHDSVIGQNKDKIIRRFLTSMPLRFETAREDVRLNGVRITVDGQTGKASGISRVRENMG